MLIININNSISVIRQIFKKLLDKELILFKSFCLILKNLYIIFNLLIIIKI